MSTTCSRPERSPTLSWRNVGEDAHARLHASSLPVFSVCTLVTDPEDYVAMKASFGAAGFSEPECEFLFLDNTTGNQFDAFAGCNILLRAARGCYVILCHQDVRAIDSRAQLEAALADLTERDPAWGVCGNAGGLASGALAIRISDGQGENQHVGGPFPRRSVSLDENFLVVRADANLAVSADLHGFHFYGADICLIADTLGRSAYVIDYHLYHRGTTLVDAHFRPALGALIAKWTRALRPRFMATTCAKFVLSPSAAVNAVANSGKGAILLGWLRRWSAELSDKNRPGR